MFSPSVCLPLMARSGQRLVGVELRDQLLARGGEVREVLLRPPVLQATFGIELRARIVEAVRDLVPDERAGGAVVHGDGAARVEIGRLQDRRREVHGVHHRQVHRVHGLRRHDPLGAVHRLAELREAELVLEQLHAVPVADGVVRRDHQRAVVEPLVGIAPHPPSAWRVWPWLSPWSGAPSIRACRCVRRARRSGCAPFLRRVPWPPARTTSPRRACRAACRARRWSHPPHASSAPAARACPARPCHETRRLRRRMLSAGTLHCSRWRGISDTPSTLRAAGLRRASRCPSLPPACQTTSSSRSARRAAVKSSAQSSPGARRANSVRFQ